MDLGDDFIRVQRCLEGIHKEIIGLDGAFPIRTLSDDFSSRVGTTEQQPERTSEYVRVRAGYSFVCPAPTGSDALRRICSAAYWIARTMF